ncbi:MAG: tyrosine-type recombinase/integrase [Terriglobia bacterium]
MATQSIAAVTKPTPPRRERGAGHLFLRGRTWWLQYMQRGRVYRESSRSTKRSVAERKLRRRLGEIHVGEFLGPRAERVRYDELAADFLNYYIVNRKKSLVQPRHGKPYVAGESHLRHFFAGYRAVEITTDRVREYVRWRQERGAANATINRSLAALKTMFHLAVKARKLREVPYIEMLEERNVRRGFLDHDQYLRLRDALPAYLKPVLAMGYYTGMRLGEIKTLRWDQVNLLDRQVRLDPGTTKNDQPRVIPLTRELLEVLKGQLQRRNAARPDCPLVFFRKERSIGNFRKAWARACRAAGVPGVLFHDLRRTAVRNLVRAGVPERVAMAISGHRSRAVFDRYNIVSERDLAEAAERLNNYLGAQPAPPATPVEEWASSGVN